MKTAVRSNILVFLNSIYAIVIRDIQKKFITNVNTNRTLGVLWIIIEPIFHISLWVGIRRLFRGSFHTALPEPLFILLGALPFFMFRNVVNGGKSSIKGNKGLYMFRQIKPIDPIVAKLISELLIFFAVMIFLLGSFIWFGIDWYIYDFQLLIVSLFFYSLFLVGVSITIAVGCFFFDFFKTVMQGLMRISYILSGVFFSAEMIPDKMREIMLYNPIFQFIEICRECFMRPNSYIPYSSISYLIMVALLSITLGLALYLVARQKIMIEIEQR